jgi:hypothetical protein
MFHTQFVGVFMTLLQINHIPSACYLLTTVINRTVSSTILCPRSNLASRDTLIHIQSSVLFLNGAVVLEDGDWQQLFSAGTLRNVKVVVAKVRAIATNIVYYLRQQNHFL